MKNNILCFMGSEENVLKRVYEAAEWRSADIIVDITSDCPFIDLIDLQLYLGPLKINAVDYVSNIIERTFPDGLDLQCYTFKALTRLMRLAYRPCDYQHVGWNFTQFPDVFKLLNRYAVGSLNWPELRITLDTIEDYELIKCIYFWVNDPTPLNIIKFLKEKPFVLQINAKIQAKTPGEL